MSKRAAFSIKEAIKTGFSRVFNNFWPSVGLTLTTAFIGFLSSPGWLSLLIQKLNMAVNVDSSLFKVDFYTPISLISSVILFLGIIAFQLFLFSCAWLLYLKGLFKIYDSQPWTLRDIWPHWNLIFRNITATLIFMFFVVGGTLLFIIPGYIAWYAFFFFSWVLIENPSMSPWQTLKESARLTKGHRLKLWLLSIVIALINAAGALLIGIGLLVTFPATFLALTHVYRHLRDAHLPLPQPSFSSEIA